MRHQGATTFRAPIADSSVGTDTYKNVQSASNVTATAAGSSVLWFGPRNKYVHEFSCRVDVTSLDEPTGCHVQLQSCEGADNPGVGGSNCTDIGSGFDFGSNHSGMDDYGEVSTEYPDAELDFSAAAGTNEFLAMRFENDAGAGTCSSGAHLTCTVTLFPYDGT
jgi:hypothetical protein